MSLRRLLALMGRVLAYPTWNPADKGANVTLSNGNRTATISATFAEGAVRATTSIPAGSSKYFEVAVSANGTATSIGVFRSDAALTSQPSTNAVIYRSDGSIITNGGIAVASGVTYTGGDTIGVRYVEATRTATFWKNNSIVGSATVNNGGTYFPGWYGNSGFSGGINGTVTFGPTTTYAPPAGSTLLENP